MSPAVVELAEMARSYCELIEGSSDQDGQWLERVAGLLPQLHAAVSALGAAQREHGHVLTADLDARFELFTHLRDLLGERDGYWMEFDVAEDGMAMSGSLADDLTDIYCELKHSLKQLDGQPEAAVEGLRRGFDVHWRQHLVDAERHLDALRAKGQLE